MYSVGYYWRKYNPVAVYRKIKNLIRNIYRYRVFLWNDRNWDFDFVYLLLESKFESMEKGISKRNILMRSQEISKELMVAKNLCKRVNQDYDFANYVRDYIESDENFLKNLNKPRTKEYTRAMYKHHELAAANKDYLWKYISKKSKGWWD